MKLSFVTLDVFTETRYEGNPLAIITVPSSERPHLTQQQKQRVASEFNLSEIVFLHESPADSSEVEVDIFTSHSEIPFAGHPTIGTASFLLQNQRDKDIKSIWTKAGPIPISRNPGSAVVSAIIPHDVHLHARTYTHPLVPGVNFPLVSIVKGMSFIHVHLPDLETLGKANGSLKTAEQTLRDSATELDEGWQTGLITTHFYVLLGVDDEGRQVIRVRMFGTREDPATGSAASALSSYLSLNAEDAIAKGKRRFAYSLIQGVEMGRKSEIGVEVVLTENGEAVDSVILSGCAVKVMEGTLTI